VLALVQLLWMRTLSEDLVGTRALFDECVSVCAEHGERWVRSYALWALGLATWLGDEPEDATRLASEALRLKRELHDAVGATMCIETLSWIAASQDDAHRAAVLLGAAAGAWPPLPGFLPQQLQDRDAACREVARHTLGPDGFDTAFACGAAMAADQAIAFALGEADGVAGDGAGNGSPTARNSTERHPSWELTERERQIADLLAAGMSNAAIGRTLVVSTRTAETHVRHIMDKLGVSTRTQIAVWAAASGDGPEAAALIT
jgi:DNA-binding CsgD family transcriptional regulator